MCVVGGSVHRGIARHSNDTFRSLRSDAGVRRTVVLLKTHGVFNLKIGCFSRAMDYSTTDLPQSCVDAASDKANFATRNARYRTAVCEFLNLRWISVGGNGNCFFESVIVLLREAGLLREDLNAQQLRLDVVRFFRECFDSTQDLCERILIEIEAEMLEELVCSTRGKINGIKIHGHIPVSRENYFDAIAYDGVWAQGWHWLRAVSFLYDVRVAVVVFGHPIVRIFGQGRITIYLYKVDADTHFDPLVPIVPHNSEVLPFLPYKRISRLPTYIVHVSDSEEVGVHSQTCAAFITSHRLRGTARIQTHPDIESVHSSSRCARKTSAQAGAVALTKVPPAKKDTSSNSFDSESGDDAVLRHSNSRTCRGAPATAKPSTKKVTSKSSDSDTGDDMPLCELCVGSSFTAGDQRVAKSIILASFKRSHVNGWCVCNNSRRVYTFHKST